MFELVNNSVIWKKHRETFADSDILVGTTSIRNNRVTIVFSDEFRAVLLHAASTAGLLSVISTLEDLRDFLLELEVK